MEYERTVSTRQFLRNFRSIKEQLLSGKIHTVRIDVGHDERLEVTRRRTFKTAADLARAARALPHPIRIRRTHIFDELLRPRKRR